MFTVLGFRLAALLARLLPNPLSEGLAVATARLAFDCRVPARAALEANLARLLPSLPRARRARLARRAFENFARSFATFLGHGRRPGRLRVVGARNLAAARSSGRGVIVLSAHLGNWERGAAELAALGIPIHLAARPQRHARLEALFSARRAAAGVGLLPAGTLLSSASGALRRAEWVALMADRGTSGTGSGSVCAWAAALARRTGALLLPAILVLEPGGGHRLVVEAPIEAGECRDGQFRRTMRRWLERWPDQWAAFEPLPGGLA